MRRLLLIGATLLLASLAGAQDYAADTLTVDLADVTFTDAYFTSGDTNFVWSDESHSPRALPVQFEVNIKNGTASLSKSKLYLTGGDLTLWIVFESGNNRWRVELPMEKDDG